MTLARLPILLMVILAGVCAQGCSVVGLPNVSKTVAGAPAEPPVLASAGTTHRISSAQEWQDLAAPVLRKEFQDNMYGQFPLPLPVSVAERTNLALDMKGLDQAEQWVVQIGAPEQDLHFSMVVLLPKSEKPVPMLIMQNFCGNALALRSAAGVNQPRRGLPKECQGSLMLPLVPVIFGGAIISPPFEQILEGGYGVALLYAGDVVPDDPITAEPILRQLTPDTAQAQQRTGAIAAWAWTYLRALDALSADERIAREAISLWGHSRNGKAALLAAAFDARPRGVIALQSGTAGGSLGRDEIGESIREITTAFPHWFAPAYAKWGERQPELPVDQHQLLALIAPRPILLGSARRDRWSDPHGAVRAAKGASPVYQLFGAPQFQQTNLVKPDFGTPMVTYMRPGLHGLHFEDWDNTMMFLKQIDK